MTAYIAFGSNLGERDRYIETAINALNDVDGCVLISRSLLYETKPLGFQSDNAFLNAVACYKTSITPEELLQVTQDIERSLGRTQKSVDNVYHDRTIDIDILDIEGVTRHTSTLTLPHPRISERRFVLEPLCEIAPDMIPCGMNASARQMLDTLNNDTVIERVTSDMLTPEVQQALLDLLPQLSSAPPKVLPAAAFLHDTLQIYIIRSETRDICGMLTLNFAPCLTGTKCWIEDVVIDSNARHRGYARRLLQHAISVANYKHARKILLTSRPQRVIANKLYQSMGFQARETNVYQMILCE